MANEIRCPKCNADTSKAPLIECHNPDGLPGHEWLEIHCICGHTYTY